METPFFFNLPDWEFQKRIPVAYSEYLVSVVPFYEYQYILKGNPKFDFKESKVEKGLKRKVYGVNFSDMTSIFAIKNLPAFRDESFISSIDDYRIKLDFQLAKINRPDGSSTHIMTDWKTLRKEYKSHDNFGRFVKKSGKPVSKLLETVLAFTDETEAEKIEKIVNFAKSEFKWNGNYGKFASQSPKSLVTKKSGNVADINLFTTALLNAAGLEAHPVIISSRGHGKIETSYPFASFFNYTIVRIKLENGIVLVDATADLIPFNRLPPRCMNDKGLVINDAESEDWVHTKFDVPSETSTILKMSPNPSNDQLEVQVIRQKTELDAYRARRNTGGNAEKLEAIMTEEDFNTVSDIKIKNYDRLRSSYVYAFRGQVDQERLNEQLVIAPFLHFVPAENYFSEPDRTYPIDFMAPNYEAFNTEIVIPPGYEIAYLPEPLNIENSLVSFNTSYRVDKNVISSIGNMNFKLGFYQPQDYKVLKQHIDQVVSAMNDRIILQKIEQ